MDKFFEKKQDPKDPKRKVKTFLTEKGMAFVKEQLKTLPEKAFREKSGIAAISAYNWCKYDMPLSDRGIKAVGLLYKKTEPENPLAKIDLQDLVRELISRGAVVSFGQKNTL